MSLDRLAATAGARAFCGGVEISTLNLSRGVQTPSIAQIRSDTAAALAPIFTPPPTKSRKGVHR